MCSVGSGHCQQTLVKPFKSSEVDPTARRRCSYQSHAAGEHDAQAEGAAALWRDYVARRKAMKGHESRTALQGVAGHAGEDGTLLEEANLAEKFLSGSKVCVRRRRWHL